MRIRKPFVAGSFYPREKEKLKEMIGDFLKGVKKTDVKNLKGLIVPHAGYVFSGRTAAYGYKLLEGLDNVRVILIGPSHFYPFYGVLFCEHDYWETPLGLVKVEKIKNKDFVFVPEYDEQEHSLEVQVPFLQVVLKNFRVVPILIGEFEPERLAKYLAKLIDKDTIVVASSDLSHYYSYERAKEIDKYANFYIPRLDIKNVDSKVEACGKLGILTLMHLAKMKGWKGKKLYYENSGDIISDKDSVVGYGCYAFYENDKIKQKG
jgi:hypothetical protein